MLPFYNNRVYSDIFFHSQFQRRDIRIVQTTHQFQKKHTRIISGI